MIKKKKILMVCNTDAALYKFRMPIIKRILSENNEVITLGGDAGYKEKLLPIVNNHYSLGCYGKINLLISIKHILRAISMVRKEKPDVIHGFTHYGNLVAWILSYFIKSNKLILTVTGMGRLFVKDNCGFLTKIKRILILNLYSVMGKFADKIIVQNDTDADLLSGYIDESKIIIQPGSGVELVDFKRKIKDKYNKLNVFMISRTIKEKGYLEYFHAAKKINELDDRDIFKFHFAGGKSLSDKWDEDIYDLARKCNVEYMGYVDDVESMLRDADIVVLPSYYREGVPRSLLEALAYDCYILTTDMPGCRTTVIDGWNGQLFKPRSVNDISAKLFSIDHNIINSSINRSQNLCCKYFNVDSIIDETIKLYDEK